MTAPTLAPTAPPAPLRHVSAPGVARLLGTWRAGGPAYRALADALRAALLAGTLAPLTRLPSERDLAAALGVSRTTTSAAYTELRDRGFATSRVGSGTVTTLPRGTATRRRGTGRPLAGDAPASDVPAGPSGRRPDGDLLDLGQATPVASPALHAAYERALEALPAYLGTGGYAHLGLDELRSAVADRYTARGTPTTPDQVLVTTGAQHAISLLAQTYLRPRDLAVVESPTYVHAMEALRSAGGRVAGVPAGDVDALVSTLHRAGARLAYVVPDCHNPTGASLDAAGRAAVRAAADRSGVTVVGDETLGDLVLDGAGHPPFAGDGASPRVVSVGSASKTFWGGLRVGWVRADAQTVHRLARTRQASDTATSVLEQLAVVELLREHEALLPARVAGLRERRDLLAGMLREALPDWDVPTPAGGLCLWVGLGRPVAQALAGAAAAEGVLVGAGPDFTPDRTAHDRVRLTFTRPPEELAEAVPRLVRAWSRVRS